MEIKSHKSVFFTLPTCGKGKLFKANHTTNRMLDMNNRCEYCDEDFVNRNRILLWSNVYELYYYKCHVF